MHENNGITATSDGPNYTRPPPAGLGAPPPHPTTQKLGVGLCLGREPAPCWIDPEHPPKHPPPPHEPKKSRPGFPVFLSCWRRAGRCLATGAEDFMWAGLWCVLLLLFFKPHCP